MPTTTETTDTAENIANALALVRDLAETLRTVCDDPRALREELDAAACNVYHAADCLHGPQRNNVRALGQAAWRVVDALDSLRTDADQLASELDAGIY